MSQSNNDTRNDEVDYFPVTETRRQMFCLWQYGTRDAFASDATKVAERVMLLAWCWEKIYPEEMGPNNEGADHVTELGQMFMEIIGDYMAQQRIAGKFAEAVGDYPIKPDVPQQSNPGWYQGRWLDQLPEPARSEAKALWQRYYEEFQ